MYCVRRFIEMTNVCHFVILASQFEGCVHSDPPTEMSAPPPATRPPIQSRSVAPPGRNTPTQRYQPMPVENGAALGPAGVTPQAVSMHDRRGLLVTPDRRNFIQSMPYEAARKVTGNAVEPVVQSRFAYTFNPMTVAHEQAVRDRNAKHFDYNLGVEASAVPVEPVARGPQGHRELVEGGGSVRRYYADDREAYQPRPVQQQQAYRYPVDDDFDRRRRSQESPRYRRY
jgi:hypothetical protein